MRYAALWALPVLCASEDRVARLEWMAGCWQARLGTVTIEETWSRPAGGLMLGFARTLKQGKVLFHEFMRIEEGVLTPRIGASAKPVLFHRTSQDDGEVRFENPSHDFPQVILYRRVPEGLLARIEGVEKGKRRAEEFPMKRVACESR